jgi:hypothetical protein
VRPLRKDLTLDAEIGYLRTDISTADQLAQPTATVGVNWTTTVGRWAIGLAPRLAYVSVSPEGGESESSLGGLFSGSAHRRLPRGTFTLDGEYFGNQLSIAPIGAGEELGGLSLLSGLERERRRLRAKVDHRLGFRFDVSAEGETRFRERLDRGETLSEDFTRGLLRLRWGRADVTASSTRTQVVGGDLPSTTEIRQLLLTWSPTTWLALDGLVQSEEREVLGLASTFDTAEVGLRLSYARLSFFARVREQEFGEWGLTTRKNRRVWIGVQRTTGGFQLGEPGR